MSVTEITLVSGERLQVEGSSHEVEAAVLAAARGSIMEFVWLTDANSRQRVAISPDHLLMLRALDPADHEAEGDQPGGDPQYP